MSVVPVASAWAAAGLVAAFLLPRARRRRLAALVPLAAAAAALLSLGGGEDLSSAAAQGGLLLGRPAGGLILLSALAATAFLLLSPPADGGEVLTLAGCGALSAVALAAGSPLTWGVCFTAAFLLLGIRLVVASPSRVTLAAGRVATLGASALAAAGPFLPVDPTSTPPRSHIAGALLAAGVAAGLALVPFGGWVSGTARTLRAVDLAPWALLLVPALVLTTQPLQDLLPPDARSVFGLILLPAGGATTLWAALRGLISPAAERYPRVLLADLGLIAMGLATPLSGARVGSLLLVVTHLCLAPLLLQQPLASSARARRLAWLAAGGIPPSPAFWGRFALLTALTATFGGASLLVTIPALGALLVIGVRALLDAPRGDPHPAGMAARLAAWLPPLAALVVGLLPGGTLRAFLGVG